MEYFISIISPIYNEEKYITKCLTSILNQDFDRDFYEIIVIDGKSTDKTRDIVLEFASKHDNISLLDNPLKTTPFALNMGIKIATGNVIIRIDGHAVIQPDYLKQCIDYLKKTKAECVGGVIESVNESFIGKAIAMAMSSSFGVGSI